MFLQRTKSDKTDEELLVQYRSDHNLEWLSSLYLRYTSLVYGVCLKYLRNREDAKDAVMQIHEKLMDSLLQHEVSNFRSWIYVFARNHCLMHLRSMKGKTAVEISVEGMENGISMHPHEDSSLEKNVERLEKCIERLAGEQRQCVTLFYLKDQCYKDIAGATGFELSKVKSYIQNGKRNLRICLEKND